MKILGFLIAIIFFIFNLKVTLTAQYFPELKFQKFFGTPQNDYPYRLIRGADKDLFMVGASSDTSQLRIGNSNGVIYKCTQDGEFRWAQFLKGNGREEIRDACYVPESDELYFCGNIGSELNHTENGDLNFGTDYLVGKLNSLKTIFVFLSLREVTLSR